MSHQPGNWNIYIRHWWFGDKKEYKIYHESCWDIGLWNNWYSQLCRKIQGKIRKNESHTRRKRPPLMTSSLASSPSLMSPTIQSAHHRSQRRENPRDEHTRCLDPSHQLCIEGGLSSLNSCTSILQISESWWMKIAGSSKITPAVPQVLQQTSYGIRSEQEQTLLTWSYTSRIIFWQK